MNEKYFKKGIEEIQSIRLTNAEKASMLKRVFSMPIESPYVKSVSPLTFIYSYHARAALVSCLVLVLSVSGAVYASGESLPGDLLYPIKTRIVESVLDVVNTTPEKKIVWEEQKVTRRIVEAEKLLEKDELDDEKLEKLEKSIQKSSAAFAGAVSAVASSTATSTLSINEKEKDLKKEFRRKINERKEVFGQEEDKDEKKGEKQKETIETRVKSKTDKIQRLKDTAIRIVDDEDGDDDDDEEDR